MRIAPNEYSIDDPEAVKIIYGLGSQFIKVRRVPYMQTSKLQS